MGMEKYRTFLAAAGEQSFSAAAEKLFLTPSAVSKHIAALEEELGVTLFVRTSSGVRLTRQGELCVPYVTRIAELYQRMGRELEAAEKAWQLNVCTIPLQAPMGLPELAGAFRSAHPGLELHLMERHGAEVEEAVLSGACELGFAADLYLDLSKLDYTVLRSDPIVAVVPASHPLAGRRRIALEELREEPFLFLPPVTGTYGAYMELCERAGFQPSVRMVTEREENILSFVSQGMGVSLLPRGLARAHPVKGVRLLSLRREPCWRMLLVWERGRVLSTAGRLFRDFAEEFFARSWPEQPGQPEPAAAER